jgi:hypothetical protein
MDFKARKQWLFVHERYLECRNLCFQTLHLVVMCAWALGLTARLVSQLDERLEQPCLQLMEEAKKDRDVENKPTLPIHSCTHLDYRIIL